MAGSQSFSTFPLQRQLQPSQLILCVITFCPRGKNQNGDIDDDWNSQWWQWSATVFWPPAGQETNKGVNDCTLIMIMDIWIRTENGLMTRWWTTQLCRVFSIVNGDIWTLKLKAKVPCSKQERKDVCVNINTDDGDINYSNAVSYGVTCAKRKRRMITDGLALGDISPSRSFLSLTEAIHLEMSRSYEQFQGLARGVMGSVHSFGHFLGMASLTGLKRISTHDHHNIHKVKAVGIVG